jgi:diguanylate cyclase (GGDEF)-like protein
MQPLRLLRPGTPIEVSIMALIAFVQGLGCLTWAAFPAAPETPRTLMVAFAVIGIGLSLMLILAGPRLPPTLLHPAIVLNGGMLTLMVATAATERGLMMSALGFVWGAVYVALFFRPQVAQAYAVLMSVALGVGLFAAHARTDVAVWLTIVVMVWVAVAVLTRFNTRLRTEAHTDGLTGLLNRTGFAAAAARQRAASKRRGEDVGLAVIDLDGFKQVNDQHGHAAGDRLLIELAGAWTSALRPTDLLARFGGDEFVLLLSGADVERTRLVLDRLVRSHDARWTVGYVPCGPDEPLDEALERADARLYAAKGARIAGARERRSPHRGRRAPARPLEGGEWAVQGSNL